MTTSEGSALDHRERSFELFYRSAYGGVVRLAFVLTGRRELAEELAQEAFLACHRRWASVSTYDNPVAWVHRVVANRCVSSGRRHLTELRLVARLRRERPPEPELAPETERIWAIVRSLPKRQAQALALAFLEDAGVREIAETLGIGEETVRTHLRRGQAAVAAELRRRGEQW